MLCSLWFWVTCWFAASQSLSLFQRLLGSSARAGRVAWPPAAGLAWRCPGRKCGMRRSLARHMAPVLPGTALPRRVVGLLAPRAGRQVVGFAAVVVQLLAALLDAVVFGFAAVAAWHVVPAARQRLDREVVTGVVVVHDLAAALQVHGVVEAAGVANGLPVLLADPGKVNTVRGGPWHPVGFRWPWLWRRGSGIRRWRRRGRRGGRGHGVVGGRRGGGGGGHGGVRR